jgi:hypothetical protein
VVRGVEDSDDCVGCKVHDANFVVSVLGKFAQLLNCVFVARDGTSPEGCAVGKDFEQVVVAIHGYSFFRAYARWNFTETAAVEL